MKVNVRERIQFYNNVTTSSPIIDQENKIQGKPDEDTLILAKKIIAVNKIKNYFRNHVNTLKGMMDNNLSTDKGFIKTVYKGVEESFHGREYYHSINKDHRIVYKPNILPSEEKSGTSKKVTGEDNNFIALEPIDKNDPFETENNFDDVKGLHSIKTGLTVSTEMIIAPNAGMCVFNFIRGGKTIPNSAFKNAANDLKTLHKRNGYLRDIKPENTAYDGKQVNFIDVDDRISRDSGEDPRELSFKRHGAEAIFTEEYITSKLVNKIYDEEYDLLNNEKIAYYLKSADEHAFLLTFIAATTESYTLRSDILDAGNKKLRSNKYELTKWIAINIKPEHIHKANLLLFYPDIYARIGNNFYLADMLYLSVK